jgi:hypothetical protein
MASLLWQPAEGRWADALLPADADIRSRRSRSSRSSRSGDGDDDPAAQCVPVPSGSAADATPLSGWAAPLWAGLGRGLGGAVQEAVVASLATSGLLQAGGALTTRHGGGDCASTDACGQQWLVNP